LSDPDENDPRSNEQPPSAIAANRIGTDARRPAREAPEREDGTGMVM
jgi:hypothetical protein